MENKNTEITNDILNTGRILVGALKAQLNGEEYAFPENTDFQKLHKLSERHKVTSLIAQSVVKCDFAPEKAKSVFQKEAFRCAARYAAQEQEMRELTEIFSEAGIKHCFLKGTKVARFYDAPDMRFMLDMDVYVEPGKFDDAEKILSDRGYELNNFEDEKDKGMVKKPFLNIELHKELKYDYDKGYDYYKGAFQRMESSDGGFALNMTKEDFYVYILSHTAHHFESAGTGIKSIVDHYYLKNRLKPLCDGEKLNGDLEKTGLRVFSDKMDELADYWFADGEKTADVEETADYIILSGVFGNEVNYYLSGIIKGDYGEKKSSYFLKRLFLPYRLMKDRYPILKKMPFLLPFLWVVRFFASLSKSRDISDEMRTINAVAEDAKDNQINFMKKHGL